MTDDTLEAAVDLWCTDEDRAMDMYGDISTWDTGEVTNMFGLFSPNCQNGVYDNVYGTTNNVRPHMATCNPNITTWYTGAVTSMERMVGY